VREPLHDLGERVEPAVAIGPVGSGPGVVAAAGAEVLSKQSSAAVDIVG